MRVKVLVVVCLVLLLSGCFAPSVAPLASEHQSPLPTQTSTPTIVPTMKPTPEPTATPTPTPSPPPEPTSTPTPTPMPVKQPPELGEKKLSFPDNIETVGYIHIGSYEFVESQKPFIFVKMSYLDGTWNTPYDFHLGDPPIVGENFYRYMQQTYDESSFYREGNFPDEFFFESEVLHRDMVFYVYDESTCLGTGHISKKPLFQFGGGWLGITSEFQMDDPSIQLEKGKSYVALMGKWNPYPAKPIWNQTGDAFEINIDGRGKIIKGRFVDKESREYSPVQKVSFVQVEYQGKTQCFALGTGYSSMEQTEKFKRFRGMISFCDYDGDGIMEMNVDSEWEGGWSTETYSFAGNLPILIFSDGGE